MNLMVPERTLTLCVEDLMVRHPEATHPDVLAVDAVEQMLRAGVQGLPVVNSRRQLKGIITLTDCLELVAMNQYPPGIQSARVTDLMTHEVHHIQPTTDLLNVVQLLRQHPWHMLPVLKGDVLVGTMTGQEVLKGLGLLQAEQEFDRRRSFPDYLRPAAQH